MKSYVVYFALLLLMISGYRSLAQDQSTKKIKVGAFKSIEIGSAFDIYIKKANEYSLSATGRPQDLEELEVEVNKGVLEVGFKNKFGNSWLKNYKKVSLYITLPVLQSANFSGAVKVMLSGFKDEEDVQMLFSGASKAVLDGFNADKLTMELSGASKIRLIGQAGKLNISGSGASDIDALDFPVRDADVNVSGASKLGLNVNKSLHVEASGASKISYKGNPMVSKDISGASSVVKIQ